MSGAGSKPARGGRRHIVERPRLTRLLDQTEADVILLVGPAGYGKTTLAQQWLADRPHGWFRATSSSTDVAALALGLTAAADSVVPEVRDRVAEKLKRFAEPGSNAESIADVLIEELRGWPAEAWLAIDDYHLAGSPSSDVLFERLRLGSGVKLLITSRERPSWASARSLLYGETYEVGQARLAMTEDEAIQVLGEHSDAAAGGLLSLADGWPAVIGLAAAAGTPIPTTGPLPETLYRYFAEELFQKARDELRKPLSICALMPSIARPVIRAVVGESAEDFVLDEGIRLGFLMTGPGDTFEMNPLIRSFLQTKFYELPEELQNEMILTIFDLYLSTLAWEDAYSLVEMTEKFALVPRLIESSIDEVLGSGRLTTLENWSKAARAHSLHGPILDFADAEVAFRRGLHVKAQTLATEAARSLHPDQPLYARAHFRVGQAAHFNDQHRQALASYERARAASTDPAITREATWASFVTALDLERSDVEEFLRAYENLPNQRVDDVLRVRIGKLSQGHRQSGLREALDKARSTAHLVGQAEDPMIRTAFWNGYAWALTLSAYYAGAIQATAHALAEAKENGLEFVSPHARLVAAQAHLGMNQTQKCARLLDEVAADAEMRDNVFLAVNTRNLRARLLLIEGKPEEAIAATEPLARPSECRSTHGERLAIRALAFVMGGEPQSALAALAQAEIASTNATTRMLSKLAPAILAHDGYTESEGSLVEALTEIALDGHLDVIVLAYRIRPAILGRLQEILTSSEAIDLLERAHDEVLAQEFGILRRPTSRQIATALSPREQEVSRLLAEGRTNAEIAKALFISEVTVKVHVRHILAKLGARNRAEAAVIVATQPDR